MLQRGDTVSPRGATMAVRFMEGDVAHGLALDSGTATLSGTRSLLTVSASGAGLEPGIGGRAALQATFDAVPIAADTVSCRQRP
jgi:hypothetical protein